MPGWMSLEECALSGGKWWNMCCVVESAGCHVLRKEPECQVTMPSVLWKDVTGWRGWGREKLKERWRTFSECLPSPLRRKRKLHVLQLNSKNKFLVHLLYSLRKQLVRSFQVRSLMNNEKSIKRMEMASSRRALGNPNSPGRLQPTES